MPTPAHVILGNVRFRIDEEADLPFRRLAESVHLPRPDVAGIPGAENLNRAEWSWSMSDFSGGEGRLVFDRNDKDPPHYLKTDGAVDTRVKGEISMSPLPALVTAVTGLTTTRFEGNTLTDSIGTSEDSGSDTIIGMDLSTALGSSWVADSGGGQCFFVSGSELQILGNGGCANARARSPDVVLQGDTYAEIVIREYSGIQTAQFTVEVYNVSTSTVVQSTSGTLNRGEQRVVPFLFTPTAGQTYRARVTKTEESKYINVVSNFFNWGLAEEVKQGGRSIANGATVTVTFRMAADLPNAPYEVRVRNATDATNVQTKSGTIAAGHREETITFTNSTGSLKTYEYYIKKTGTGIARLIADYIDEVAGSGALTDTTALQQGYADEVFAVRWDGTNSDVFKWDFTNNDWDAVHENMVASKIVAMANSDRYQYTLHANGQIYRLTATASSGVQYTAAGLTAPLGLAVANNRIYALFREYLYEIAIDQTAGLPLAENTANYKRVANPGDFYNAETADQDLRQQITGIGNGVRFFTTVRGGPTTIWEYSDGALRPIATIERGFTATAIFHYSGVTWIGVKFTSRGPDPSMERAGIYYIAADLVPRFLGYLRFQEPEHEPVRFITAYGHNIFFLQGHHVWRYDAGGGGLTLEAFVPAPGEEDVRGLAVMDLKFWIGCEAAGTFVSQNAYPKDTTVWTYSPVWDFDVPDMDKTLLRFDVVTKPLPANTSIEMQYQLDEDGTWVSAGTADTDNAKTHPFAVSTSTNTRKFRTMQWRIGMRSSDGVFTPTVRSVTTRAYVLKYSDAFEMTLLLDDDTSNDRVRGQQLTGRAKAQLLWNFKNAENLVSFEDHYSASRPGVFDTYTVICEDPYQDIDLNGQGSARIRLRVV